MAAANQSSPDTVGASVKTQGDRWERKITLIGLVGTVWGCVLLTAYGMGVGITVPHEVYYLGSIALGALSALLHPVSSASVTGQRQANH